VTIPARLSVPTLLMKWLPLRRIRAQAIVLALCLWGVCAVDFATPGLFDRVGNIKFQDFLAFYISAQQIAQHRASDLYDQKIGNDELLAIVRRPTGVHLPYLYGPQVGLMFVPLASLSFPAAARIWVVFSLLVYFACIYAIWRRCRALRPYSRIVTIAAVAFPPLFHFFVRGQNSVIVLAFFTAAFLALRADRRWLAGIVLGFLAFKPQFLIAIPLILVVAHAWKIFAGLAMSAVVQLAFARAYFGTAVMQAYFDTLQHTSRWITTAEANIAPIQMHSLRSFWSLLIPLPTVALVLYVLSSICVVWIASVIWNSVPEMALRFSALTLAAVLVNPHLFVYDLLVLAPVVLLVTDWTLAHNQHPASPALRLLIYLSFLLPLFGPISRWTHVQLSVIVFIALLLVLFRFVTASHKLASGESAVV
jgi:alpha-1,2-mannosyltransferase